LVTFGNFPAPGAWEMGELLEHRFEKWRSGICPFLKFEMESRVKLDPAVSGFSPSHFHP
jgi:hypothetical protein